MKIECSREQLASALSRVEKIATKNVAMQILSCVLIDATADKLLIRATNLEIALEIAIPASILTKGIVAVPAHAIAAYTASLDKDKMVTLELVQGNIKISSSSNETLIKAQPHDDFPTIPALQDVISFSIKPSVFVEGIKSVSFAAGQSSIKPELSSVYIYTGDNELIFVATDSFRLAEKRIKIKTTEQWNALIPVKNIADIVRILEDINGEVEIMVNKYQIVIRTPHLYLTSRVVEGSFPDYRQIIPKESKTEVTVLKKDLLHAFKIATIFSDKFNKLSVKVIPKDTIFSIKTSNSDVGETITTLDASITGDEIDINFNAKYIIDCMQSITTNSVVFQFNGVNKLVLKGSGDTSYLYLVMPMNR